MTVETFIMWWLVGGVISYVGWLLSSYLILEKVTREDFLVALWFIPFGPFSWPFLIMSLVSCKKAKDFFEKDPF